MKKKKIIIIGAGISGMTAGIYALQNGFNVEIYEKHSISGGQCTGWRRDNTFIDGCAHWIVGTNPESELFPLWKNIGAFDENSNIYDTQYFTKVDVNGEIVTFYADINKLQNELLRISPQDKKQIKKFIKGIKAYMHVHIPVRKPIDMMNLFELTSFGLKFLPMLRCYLKYRKVSIKKFSKGFKSPILQTVFCRILSKDYNMHSLLYTMQALAKKDAGVIEGGSLKLALRVQKRFESLGGIIHFNSNVKKINIKNKIATSITLDNDDIITGDYIISSGDAYYALNNLLDGKYNIPFINNRFKNIDKYPLSQCLLCSYKLTKNISDLPKMIDFAIKPFKIGNEEISFLTIRNHAFDKTLNNDSSTTITVLLQTANESYDYFKSLDKEEYITEKNRIGNIILKNIINYYKLDNNDIKLIDVTTPLTYERYTNAYRGSYMSFINTKHSKGLMTTGKIKGIKNLIITGQWLMPPGGLPIALFTGKHAAMRITKMEKRKFIQEKA